MDSGRMPTACETATMLAVPPIHPPETEDSTCHESEGSQPRSKAKTARNARSIDSVAHAKPSRMRGPSARMAFMSQLTSSRNINAGNSQSRICLRAAVMSASACQKPPTDSAVTAR